MLKRNFPLFKVFVRTSPRAKVGQLLCLLLAAPLWPAVAQTSVHDELRHYAEDYVRDLVPLQPGDRLQVDAASIDTRLSLTECLGKLTADIRGAGEVRRNTHVYLQCHEQPGWDLFVPVRVKILKPVVTAADKLVGVI